MTRILNNESGQIIISISELLEQNWY